MENRIDKYIDEEHMPPKINKQERSELLSRTQVNFKELLKKSGYTPETVTGLAMDMYKDFRKAIFACVVLEDLNDEVETDKNLQ